jgi:hypothetical protein
MSCVLVCALFGVRVKTVQTLRLLNAGFSHFTTFVSDSINSNLARPLPQSPTIIPNV